MTTTFKDWLRGQRQDQVFEPQGQGQNQELDR